MLVAILASTAIRTTMQSPIPVVRKGASDAKLQRLGFDPSRIQALRTRLDRFVAEGRLPGYVFHVERNGELVMFDAVGWQDVARRAPMRLNSVFQVMSMTKPITAVAVIQCVEAGSLRLQDPIRNHLPEFGEDAANIRVRHLLNHTSGIASDMPISDEERAKSDLAAFVRLIAQQKLVSEPGSKERYSGPGTSVLGRLVELASAKDFETYLQNQLFQPLTMRDSSLFYQPGFENRLVGVGMLENGQLKSTSDDGKRTGARFANPAGGLYSTAEDMARWHRAMLIRDRRLLSPASYELMQTISTRVEGSSDEFGFGLGWSIVRGPGPSRTLLPPGTFGHAGSFGTYGWCDPKNRISGDFLTQRLFGAEQELDVFRTMLYASLRK
jgi:CubicO group peptidase (beta-lactamase class C family)